MESNEQKVLMAIATWLNIDPKGVKEYSLIHRCRPLKVIDLVELLKEGNKTPLSDEVARNIHNEETTRVATIQQPQAPNR